MKKQKKLIISIVLGLILVDQIVKISLLLINKSIIGETSQSNDNITYILLSIIVVGVLIRYINSDNSYIKTETRIVLCFAIAGALSNVIDRLWNGSVLNYIQIPNFATLNLAYIYIIITWIGMAIILTKHSFKRMKEKREGNKK